MKENCRHVSAETSKAFSLEGKYLKANIQLTLLLLQTPVTCRCLILACRVVLLHANICLNKNTFSLQPTGLILNDLRGNYTELRGSDGSLKLTLLIREYMMSRDLLLNSLEARVADLES